MREMKMNQLTQGITILVTVISTEKPSIKYSAISKPSVMTHRINYFALMPTYVEISQLSGKDLSTIYMTVNTLIISQISKRFSVKPAVYDAIENLKIENLTH